MKIKVVRRFARGQYQEGTEPLVYDIYHKVGVFPLFKKWKICRSALDRKDALEYLSQYIVDLSCKVIIDC
jgi:hypothetical protein